MAFALLIFGGGFVVEITTSAIKKWGNIEVLEKLTYLSNEKTTK